MKGAPHKADPYNMWAFGSCSELLAKERNDLYWQFVDQWLEADDMGGHQTDKDCVQHIEQKGSSYLGPPLCPLFQLSLSLRSASPKLILYRQLAEESLAAHFSTRKVSLNSSVILLICLLFVLLPPLSNVFPLRNFLLTQGTFCPSL